MELFLKRTYLGDDFTAGSLYVMENNVPKFVCNTLEPKYRDLRKGDDKVEGKTAIPEGRYKLKLQYSPKFKRLMPYLMEVPGFSGIMIHPGNYPHETEGCILVGEELTKRMVIESQATFKQVYGMIEKNANQNITIVIF